MASRAAVPLTISVSTLLCSHHNPNQGFKAVGSRVSCGMKANRRCLIILASPQPIWAIRNDVVEGMRSLYVLKLKVRRTNVSRLSAGISNSVKRQDTLRNFPRLHCASKSFNCPMAGGSSRDRAIVSVYSDIHALIAILVSDYSFQCLI